MAFTLDQLNFLSLYVGVAIPPEFIENKKRAEAYAKRSAEISARADEMKQRSDGAKLQDLVNQAASSAAGKDFAAALNLLDQVEAGLAVPDAPPPRSAEPEVQPKARADGQAVAAELGKAQPLQPLPPAPAENAEKDKFEKRWAVTEPKLIEVLENQKLAAYAGFPKLQPEAERCTDLAPKIKDARDQGDFAKANLELDAAEKALAALNQALPGANAFAKKGFEEAKAEEPKIPQLLGESKQAHQSRIEKAKTEKANFKKYAKLIKDGKFGNPPPTKAKHFDLDTCVSEFGGAHKRMTDSEAAGNYIVAKKSLEKAAATVALLDTEVKKFISYCKDTDQKSAKIAAGVDNPIYKDGVKEAAQAVKAAYDPAAAAIKNLEGDKADFGATYKLVVALEAAVKELQTRSAGELSKLSNRSPVEARAEVMKFLKQDPGVLKALAKQDKGTDFLDSMVADLGDSASDADSKDFVKAALMARFDLDRVEGNLTTKALPRLYKVMKLVPESHTKENERLKIVERHRGSKAGASFYEGKSDKVILNLERTGKWRGHTEYMKSDKSGKVKVSSFDSTTLHEIGHSVDEKRGFFTETGSMLDKKQYGGWRYEDPKDIVKLALDDKGLANNFKTIDKAVLEKFVQAVLAAKNSEECEKELKDVKAGDKKKLWKHAAIKWCATVRIKGEHKGLWDQGGSGAKKAAIKGRVYQESYKTKWTSYLVEARARGVSQYQFRAPGEWFAELYAFYYLNELPHDHQDYDWFRTLVDL